MTLAWTSRLQFDTHHVVPGWLSDLYWQRRYLFGIGAKGPGGGGGRRGGVLRAGRELIEKSTFIETWRRNRYGRENRFGRLDEEAEAGQTGATGEKGRGSRLGRHKKLGAGHAGNWRAESCSDDDEEITFDEKDEGDVHLQIYGGARRGTPNKIEVAEEVGAAAHAGAGAADRRDAVDEFDALAMQVPAGAPTAAPTATSAGPARELAADSIHSGAVEGRVVEAHTDELDQLAIHEASSK